MSEQEKIKAFLFRKNSENKARSLGISIAQTKRLYNKKKQAKPTKKEAVKDGNETT